MLRSVLVRRLIFLGNVIDRVPHEARILGGKFRRWYAKQGLDCIH
jgi:hypothetical protein